METQTISYVMEPDTLGSHTSGCVELMPLLNDSTPPNLNSALP